MNIFKFFFPGEETIPQHPFFKTDKLNPQNIHYGVFNKQFMEKYFNYTHSFDIRRNNDNTYPFVQKINLPGLIYSRTTFTWKGVSYEVTNQLGQGATGTVFGIRYKDNNNYVENKCILKIIHKNERRDTINELLIQTICYETLVNSDEYKRDPRKYSKIPQIHGMFSLSNVHDAILMEHVGSTLDSIFIKFMGVKKYEYTFLLSSYQIMNTLSVLSKYLYFDHRDLKPNNIMYKTVQGITNSNGYPIIQTYIIDFGNSFVKLSSDYTISAGSEFTSNVHIPHRDIIFFMFHMLSILKCGESTHPNKKCKPALNDSVYTTIANYITRFLNGYQKNDQNQTTPAEYEGYDDGNKPKWWKIYLELNNDTQEPFNENDTEHVNNTFREIRSYIVRALKDIARDQTTSSEPYFFGKNKI